MGHAGVMSGFSGGGQVTIPALGRSRSAPAGLQTQVAEIAIEILGA